MVNDDDDKFAPSKLKGKSNPKGKSNKSDSEGDDDVDELEQVKQKSKGKNAITKGKKGTNVNEIEIDDKKQKLKGKQISEKIDDNESDSDELTKEKQPKAKVLKGVNDEVKSNKPNQKLKGKNVQYTTKDEDVSESDISDDEDVTTLKQKLKGKQALPAIKGRKGGKQLEEEDDIEISKSKEKNLGKQSHRNELKVKKETTALDVACLDPNDDDDYDDGNDDVKTAKKPSGKGKQPVNQVKDGIESDDEACNQTNVKNKKASKAKDKKKQENVKSAPLKKDSDEEGSEEEGSVKSSKDKDKSEPITKGKAEKQ